MIRAVLDLLIPRVCLLCETLSDQELCQGCLAHIPFYEQGSTSIPYVDLAISLTEYRASTKKCLEKIKFHSWQALARCLGSRIQEMFEEPPFQPADLWTSVPIHPRRQKLRGFNQVDLLFEGFLRKFSLPSDTLFQRVKNTPPLYELSKEQRQTILENAFEVRSGFSLEGARIVILDDILTSGATLSACASLLKAKGAKKVYALCLGQS